MDTFIIWLFFRLQLIRMASESYLGNELGLISNYNKKKCYSFLKMLEHQALKNANSISSDILHQSKKIFKNIKKPKIYWRLNFHTIHHKTIL